MKPGSILRSLFLSCLLLLAAATLLGSCSTPPTAALSLDVTQSSGETKTTPSNDWPTETWRTSSPEEQGMDAQMLSDMLDRVQKDQLELHSLLIIRHGAIVSETYFKYYAQNTPHPVWSCTKSVMSTLIGIAIDRGLIRGIDQKVVEFFPGETFAGMNGSKESMTLENLLTMTTGLNWDENVMDLYGKPDWVKYVLDLPQIHKPGETFNYCTGCSHVLSVILEKKTGVTAETFAQKNLFSPLGIKNYTWESSPEGSSIGGWGLHLTPRDMAKLGYLYLHNGEWDGQQIVSRGWVKNATQRHAGAPFGDGYGYLWWVYPKAYAALGMNGQIIYVAPELDLIVVATANIPNHGPVFQLIDQYIVPSVH